MTLSIHITETELLVDNQLVGPRPEHVSREEWANLANHINDLSDQDNILEQIIKLTEERDEALDEASEYEKESVGYRHDYEDCRSQLYSIKPNPAAEVRGSKMVPARVCRFVMLKDCPRA